MTHSIFRLQPPLTEEREKHFQNERNSIFIWTWNGAGQNGKTLIRDYSIPDQRSGFNPRFNIKYTLENIKYTLEN